MRSCFCCCVFVFKQRQTRRHMKTFCLSGFSYWCWHIWRWRSRLGCQDSAEPFVLTLRTVLMPTDWTWVFTECVEKCWVLLSPDRNVMTKNKLKLNEQKTEVLFCGPSSRRESVPADCLSISEASIPFSNVVKTLGVTLDAELSMEQHVSAVVRSVFFHIRSLGKVRPYIIWKAEAAAVWFCQSLATAMAFCRDCPKSRLNIYWQCKMLLQELSWNEKGKEKKKKRKQKTNHMTPILRQLHWLSIQERICHKILSVTYRSVHDNTYPPLPL